MQDVQLWLTINVNRTRIATGIKYLALSMHQGKKIRPVPVTRPLFCRPSQFKNIPKHPVKHPVKSIPASMS